MHTIWRFEKDILIACRDLLGACQKLLHCEFPLEIFMVGVERESQSVRFSSPSQFVTVEEIEEKVGPLESFPVYPAEHASDEDWQKSFDKYDNQCIKWWNAIRRAIRDACIGKGIITFVSPCVEINDNMVAVVAIVREVQILQYPTLPISVYDEHGRWPSLHFGVIETVLQEFAGELRKRNPGRFEFYRASDPHRILRAAAEHFTQSHGMAGNPYFYVDIFLWCPISLFDICNIIASSGYERRVGFGGMILAEPSHLAIEITLKYKDRIPLANHRGIRKLLEMCKNGVSILSNSRYAFGLGRVNREKYDPAKMDIFSIQFTGHSHWQMSHLDTVLMDVKYGNPSIPQPAIPVVLFRQALRKQFTDLADSDYDVLRHIVTLAASANHGAVVVISRQAAAECQRLVGDNGIVSFSPNDDSLEGAFAIDGAVMVDLQGVCHGLGLILDGIETTQVNRARGARYNSSRRYFDSHPDCVVIVISEDGMFDIFPEESTESLSQKSSRAEGHPGDDGLQDSEVVF